MLLCLRVGEFLLKTKGGKLPIPRKTILLWLVSSRRAKPVLVNQAFYRSLNMYTSLSAKWVVNILNRFQVNDELPRRTSIGLMDAICWAVVSVCGSASCHVPTCRVPVGNLACLWPTKGLAKCPWAWCPTQMVVKKQSAFLATSSLVSV